MEVVLTYRRCSLFEHLCKFRSSLWFFSGGPKTVFFGRDVAQPNHTLLLPVCTLKIHTSILITSLSCRMVQSDVIAAWSAPHWHKESSGISLNQSCCPNLIFTLWQMRKLLDWNNCTTLVVWLSIISFLDHFFSVMSWGQIILILLLLDYIFLASRTLEGCVIIFQENFFRSLHYTTSL